MFHFVVSGDLVQSAGREGRNAILVAGQDQIQCVKQALHKEENQDDNENNDD